MNGWYVGMNACAIEGKQVLHEIPVLKSLAPLSGKSSMATFPGWLLFRPLVSPSRLHLIF